VVRRSSQGFSKLNTDEIVLFSGSGGNILTAIPLIVFAFRSHTNMPPIYKELRDNTNVVRMRAVVFLSVSICAVLYYINGIFGYLDFLGITDPNVLNNFSDGDALAGVARFLLIFVMVCHYPVVAFTTRSAIDYLIFGNKPLTNTRHICETVFLWACFFGVSIAIPTITVILGLAGSLPFSEFLFPSIFLRKFHKNKKWTGITGTRAVVASYAYLLITIVIAVACTSSIIYKHWVEPHKHIMKIVIKNS